MFITATLALALFSGCATDTSHAKKSTAADVSKTTVMTTDTTKVVMSDADWQKKLTATQYSILREKDTERPFTGQYWNNTAKGIYRCAGCGAVLFSSDQKFDAGCGWPSFSLPWDSTAVIYQRDSTFGMDRTEVLCRKCGGHLGHVFDDGPPPSGLRYCINSGAMVFEPIEIKK